MLRPFSLLALLLLVPPAAEGAVCTSLGAFSWPAIGSGSWSCGAGGPGDQYVIAAGHTVTVTGDLVQSDSATAGITVGNGGSLIAVGTQTLRLGGAGLVCQPGSSCRLEGAGFREPDATLPDLSTSLTHARFFRVQESVPCPGPDGAPDCSVAGAENLLRLRFPHGAPSGASRIAPGDVLCFGDPAPDDDVTTPDAGACYVVQNDPGASLPLEIDLDVRQSPSLRAASGYPLALRSLRESTVETPGGAPAGTRSVLVGASVLSQSHQLVGRWLRFADDTGAPERRGYKILRTEDGGAGPDLVTIAAPEGFLIAHPQGRTVFIDYGVGPGDPFYVFAPVTLESATASELDSQVRFGGTTTVRRLLADGLGAQYNGLANTGAFLFQSTAAVVAFEDVWLADPSSPSTGVAFMVDGTDGLVVRRFQQTGGSSSDAGCVPYGASCIDDQHAIAFRGAVLAAALEDVTIRHHGDDVFLNAAASPLQLTIRRAHAAFVSRYADTGNLLDGSGLVGTYDLADVLCDDCTSPPNLGSAGPLFIGLEVATGSLRRLVALGTRGSVACVGVPQCEDVTALGSEGATGFFLGGRARNVAVRELEFTSASSAIAPQNVALELEGALVRNSSFGNQQGLLHPTSPSAPLRVTEAVFENVNGPSTSFLLNGGSPTAEVRLTRVSASWSGPHTMDRFHSSYGATQTAILLDRVLVQGLEGPAEVAVGLELSQIQTAGPSCFFDNTSHWLASQAPFVPGAWISGNGIPTTQSPRTADYPWNDAGCGATGVVGVSTPSWALSKSRLQPEFYGEVDGDGIPAPADNCPLEANAAQADADADGVGDACDTLCIGEAETEIDELEPPFPWSGGAVTIRGAGFGSTAAVFFDGVPVYVVARTPELRVMAPTLTAGATASVRVVNPEGCVTRNPFTFTVGSVPTSSCGLVGIELVPVLVLAARRRRRPSRG